MGSGNYPLNRNNGAGAVLVGISERLKKLLASRGDDHYANVPDCLPAAYDNDQYDNAARDGNYETYLELASELIERCLEPVEPVSLNETNRKTP